MRILTRYILREVTAHALIGAAIFTFVLFTRDLGRILELVVRASAPLPSVAEIFFFTVPLALTYTLPMSVLVGILIGLSRLAADSEITAMRASGMGVWSFLRALSIFVIAAWLLAMFNGLYIAPRAQAALGHLEDRLKGSQVSFEIQPRVFYEGFPKKVLYVQDVKTAQGAAVWKGVFMADLSDATNPTITLAKEAIVVSEGQDRLHLHLIDGSEHVTDPKDAGHYQISTFQQTDIPLDLPSTENKPDESLPAEVMDTGALWQKAGRVDPISARWYLIAFHRRFALPTACLVLALVGIPLGLSSKKSGKSGGFVLTILLVFVYYVISLVGVSLARQGKVSPWFGAWLADFVFLALAIFLLLRAEKRPFEMASFRAVWKRDPSGAQPSSSRGRRENAFERASTRRRMFSASFPTLLDDYVLRDFFLYLAMILSTFLVLVIVFTLFELLGDILKNQVPATVVAEYLLNVAPYLLYNVAPAGHAAGCAGHLRHDATVQRNYRDQGHRNQHLPHRHPGNCGRGRAGRGTVFRRPVLPAPHQQAPGSSAQPDQRQASADLPASRPQMDFRPEQRHLLLPVLRSRSRPVRQRHGVSSSTAPASPSRAASTPTAPTGPTI